MEPKHYRMTEESKVEHKRYRLTEEWQVEPKYYIQECHLECEHNRLSNYMWSVNIIDE